MNTTDHDQTAMDHLIEVALAEHLGGEEPGRTPEEIVAALDAAPAGRLRSMRGSLEIAAAALLLAFAAWGLPRFLAPAGPAEESAAAPMTEEKFWEELRKLRDPDAEVRREALLTLLRDGDRTLDLFRELKPEIVEGSLQAQETLRLLAALPLSSVLGPDRALAFGDAEGPVERCRALVPDAGRLRERGVSRQESLRLGDGILEDAPWRETYDDGKHQKDLFEIRELCEENELTFLGGLFARMAEHPAPYVRLHGIMGLRILGAVEFTDVAEAATADPDSRVRVAALSTLMKFDAAGGAERLARALADSERGVRQIAVQEVGDYGRDGVVRSLILKALEDEAAGVRMAAATRIEVEQDASALPHLRAAREKEKSGSAAQVLDSTIRSLADLEGTRIPVAISEFRFGDDHGERSREYLRFSNAQEWEWAVAAIGLSDPPAVDFERLMVLVVHMGRTGNCSGVDGKVFEDDGKLMLRFRGMWYQTEGPGEPPGLPWGLFVIPRSNKPVVFLENTAGIIGMPPVWTERARLPALDKK